jgi:hypothetical protein
MIQAANAAALDPGTFQGFLTYGPLGLAGLFLVLVVTALSLRRVDEAAERVLKLVLFIGAFCFIAALIAQHFTPPDKETPSYSKQRVVLTNTEKALNDAAPKLQQIIDLAGDAKGCPGGGSGLPIPHGNDMAIRSSSVLATLEGAKSNIHAVFESLPDGK